MDKHKREREGETYSHSEIGYYVKIAPSCIFKYSFFKYKQKEGCCLQKYKDVLCGEGNALV